MNLTITVMPVFRDWLLRHEQDIAFGINDFEELRATFREVFGREASQFAAHGEKIKEG